MEPSSKETKAVPAGSISVGGMASDITERQRAEEALSESDRRYQVLFESAGDGIFLSRGSHFVDCNQRGLELFGCTRDQLIGNTPAAFSPPRQTGASANTVVRINVFICHLLPGSKAAIRFSSRFVSV